MLRPLSGRASFGSDAPRRQSTMSRHINSAKLAVLCSVAVLLAAANTSRAAKAEQSEIITVPSPAEFFAAIDKIAQPDWASFYRDPAPTSYSSRPQTAVNLGALVADGYIAVEAQDGQQVKNTGKDIIALARSLGVGEHVLSRGKSISDFADKNDWAALKEELEATTNEVRMAMADQRDEALASLIAAGAWIRSLQVGSRSAELSGEEAARELLRQSSLVAYLNGELEHLPEKISSTAAAVDTRAMLAALVQTMKTEDQPLAGTQAAEINGTTSRFIALISAKPQ